MSVAAPGASLVVCVGNEGYGASLTLRKIYRVVEDAEGRRHGLLRVVDDTEEDYLFSEVLFAPVQVPEEVEKSLFSGS